MLFYKPTQSFGLLFAIITLWLAPHASGALDVMVMEEHLQQEQETEAQQGDSKTQVLTEAPGAPAKLFDHQSIESAWEAAVEQNKPLLVMFSTKRCVYCTKMMEKTYGDPHVQQMLSRNVETVVAQPDQYRPLIQKMGIRGYPFTVIVSPEGQVLDFIQGFVEPRKFAERVTPLIEPHVASTASVVNLAAADR